jgi:hypothetical protein
MAGCRSPGAGTSRGAEHYLCEKVANCIRGGGLAAVVYNREGSRDCQALYPTTLAAAGGAQGRCSDATRYVPTVTLTLAQGRALQALLQAGQAPVASVVVPDPKSYATRVGPASRCQPRPAAASRLSYGAGAGAPF